MKEVPNHEITLQQVNEIEKRIDTILYNVLGKMGEKFEVSIHDAPDGLYETYNFYFQVNLLLEKENESITKQD